jgi:hypothetical protein
MKRVKPVVLFGLASWLLVLQQSVGQERSSSQTPPAKLVFQSSNPDLNKAFEWAKRQALAYAFEDDPVGPWYEAALPGREAFCMRDVSHQSMGAHVLGLARHTKNMLMKFAENISESKDWCSYWEINRYGLPAPVDYVNDVEFWYNLPANFDVLDCCYRMYLWTGDRVYIDHPVFLNFYERTVKDYVERWDLGLDGIMTRQRILNTRGRPDPKNRFQTNRGIPSYDEGGTDFTVALDQLAIQYAGYLAYARIHQHRGNLEEANEFLTKAKEMKAFLNDTWWDAGSKRYYSHMDLEHRLVHDDYATAVPYYGATDDGVKINAVVDGLVRTLSETPPLHVEVQSHLPQIFYRYGRPEPAYEVLLELTQRDRREYPEVSFSVVGSFVTGLMGIELEARSPTEALVKGHHVDQILTTLPQLTSSTAWAELRHVPVRANDISVRHDGSQKTTLTNNRGPSFLWKARFMGTHETLLVNGEPFKATRDELFSDGPKISWVRVTMGAGEQMTVGIPK